MSRKRVHVFLPDDFPAEVNRWLALACKSAFSPKCL